MLKIDSTGPNPSPLASTGAKDVQMRARFGPSMLSKRLSSQNSHLTSMDYLCTLPSACSLSCPHKWQKPFRTPLSPKNIQAMEEETNTYLQKTGQQEIHMLPSLLSSWHGSSLKMIEEQRQMRPNYIYIDIYIYKNNNNNHKEIHQ